MILNNHFSVLAPAKLNLRLKITGRRQDGYHLLSMINASIALYDQLDFEILHAGSGIDLKINSAPNIKLEATNIKDNLVYRAVKLFFEQLNIKNYTVNIKLNKNIPVGAGLGGGSSDAASTLLALSKYFFPDLQNLERLQQLSGVALKLGSDLPFFLHAGLDNALYHVSGIGELAKKMSSNPLSKKELLLISPDLHISTISVYKAFASSNPIVNRPDNMNIDQLLTYQQILEHIDNDLSEEVFKLSSECREILKYLKKMPNFVSSVTGSGSSIFCLPVSETGSQALKELQSDLECIKTSFLLKSQIVQFL